MRASINYKNIIIIYALELCLCYSIINYALSKLELSGLPGVRYIDALFLVLSFVFVSFNKNSRQSSISKLLLAFSLCCIPSLFAFDQYSLSFHNLTTLFVPYLSYVIGSNISKFNGIQTINTYIIFVIAIIWVSLVVVRQYAINSMELIRLRDYTFAIVALFPFLFLLKNRALKIILQVLAFVMVLISVKRSLILGMVAALFLYYFFSIYWNRKYGFGNKIWLTLLIVVVSLGVLNYMGSAQEINDVLEKRFEDLDEDGGSGRDVIYETIFDNLEMSSTSTLLFGHGYNAIMVQIFGHPAHNDALELLYDYGLFAAFMWIIFVLTIAYRSVCLIVMGEVEIGGMMIATWVMWVMIFMTNCIYVNTSISAAFYVFFGFLDRQTINTNRYAISQSVAFRRTI